MKKESFLTLLAIGIYSALISANIYMAAPNFNLLKDEFKATDVVVSLVSSLFYLALGSFSIIWAYIIDKNRWSRKKALALLTILASSSLVFVARSTNIIELILFYTLTGVFLGGSFSLIFGILSDKYPLKIRLAILAIWNLMYGIGSSAGYFISIIIGEASGWRNVFLTSSTLIGLSIIPLAFIKEPRIGESEELLKPIFERKLNYTFKLKLKNIGKAINKPTNKNIFLQYLFLSVGWGAYSGWAIHFIMRETGLSKTNTAVILGFIAVMGAFHVYIAQLVQAKQGEKLHKKLTFGAFFSAIEGTAYIALFSFLPRVQIKPIEGSILNQIAGILLSLLNYPHIFVILIFAGIGNMLGSTTKPIDTATISEINLPEEKATIVGYLYIFELIGKSLGVFLAGAISTITGNLKLGLLLCLLFYYFGSIMWYLASKTYWRDRENQQKILVTRVSDLLFEKKL